MEGPSDHHARLVEERVREHIRCHERLLEEGCAQAIAAAGAALAEAFRSGGKVLAFGNGGSAADAQHLVGELAGRFLADREPLPALALTTNPSTVTAVANDYGFAEVFARQVRGLAKPGDAVVAITTSGGSENVLRALSAARERGAVTVALTGSGGGRLREVADHVVVVPSDSTPRIQEAHVVALHALCEIVERELFG